MPFNWADFEKFFNLVGWPGIGLLILWKVWRELIPRIDRHLDSLNAYLDTAKSREISQDDSMREIRTGVVTLVNHTVPPANHPTWVKDHNRHKTELGGT